MTKPSRIGFVSTRLSGTDGVSLETRKWVNVLTRMGHDCFFFAGESDWAEEISYIVPEAHFKHPDLDGVSLETRKWVNVLTRMGHDCFFFAGESDWAEEISYIVPEAHFKHPD